MSATAPELPPADLQSMAEVAARLNVSDDLVRKLVDQGLLPAIELGVRRLIPRAAIDAVIAESMADFDPKAVVTRLSANRRGPSARNARAS